MPLGGRRGFKDPKTRATRRTLTLPGVVRDVLGEHLGARPVVGHGLVFTDTAGGPLRRSNFARRDFKPAVAASVGEPCRVHDLRHTHAAWLIANGEHAKTIQARLGHASIKTTLDRYGHLMPGLDEDAADRLDELAAGEGSIQEALAPLRPFRNFSPQEPKITADQGLLLVGVDGLEPPTPAL